jgi:nitrite reductase/ring-hydroxylating ferredoxin subunit
MESNTLYEKVEAIKRPIVIGEVFSVACLVKRNGDKITSFIPIINTPHTDKENGQPEVHYHVDYRFVLTKETKDNVEGFLVIDERDGFEESQKARVEVGVDGELEFHNLPVISEKHNGLTQLKLFIRNSKLKRKCIHKGRCPHRGFDLSQEKPVNGIITCPLHALEFHADSGNITENILNDLKIYRDIEIKYKNQLNKALKMLSKIKDGDILTSEEYNKLNQYPLNTLYSIYTKRNGDYNEIEWTKERTNDFPSKPLQNGEKIKFKVKISNLVLENSSVTKNG